jgi:monofunctional biosynthetic peptidoglycan transglycosylase
MAQLLYVILLRWVPPPTTLTMITNHLSLGKGESFHKKWVPYRQIADAAKLAVIASEDQRFAIHHGFDLKSIQEAWKENQQGKRIRGASTISQQTAKNVFLWQGRSWVRKGLEAYFTFMIEHIWGKKRILEVYLNVAQTGDHLFGIEAAAQTYYGKPAAKLTRPEAATIAACLPDPEDYRVSSPSSYIQRRRGWILHQMSNLQSDPAIGTLLQK